VLVNQCRGAGIVGAYVAPLDITSLGEGQVLPRAEWGIESEVPQHIDVFTLGDSPEGFTSFGVLPPSAALADYQVVVYFSDGYQDTFELRYLEAASPQEIRVSFGEVMSKSEFYACEER